MTMKKHLGWWAKKKFLGCIFAFVLMLSSLFTGIPGITGVENAYAEPEEEASVETSTSCEDSLGSLGWLVCPATGKISNAVDFLYDKIDDVLVVNPTQMEEGSPVFEIWKYFQGVTNILFAIFLLVVVLSQITGVGITNYGIKKALPKLIIAAILVNLSFYICSLAVDVSNIFGANIRGLFDSIAASTSQGMAPATNAGVHMSEAYSALAGGGALAIAGGAVAVETGAIWMLIPLALGALVSVVIGLITIAMRQAVVTLLIMVAPLAIVAYILPNTEPWFKKWRQLLFQMLIFYPAFSLLFGASSLAGWAIIVSADNSFTKMVGIAVQVFPLFFSWGMMKMSGTILGTINSKLTGLTTGMVGGVRGWATSHQALSKQKHLASPNAYTPSMRLQQFLSDRRIAREEETREHMETVKNRGLAYNANRAIDLKTGLPTKEGEEAYEAQARNAEYQKQILRNKNNMNKGLGQLDAVKKNGTMKQKARLNALDGQNVQAFDTLKMEQARGERIDYKNAMGFHNRMEAAMNAHMDSIHTGETDRDGKITYKPHFEIGSIEATQAADRYADLSKIMEGDVVDAQYAVATAAHGYDTQAKIMTTKMQKYFELAPPTKDVVLRLDELTKVASDAEIKIKAAENIDAIIAGLRVLNMRGDTDLVKEQMDNILDKNIGGGIELGTHASQALASFLMFEVKDSDPWLRRFGKYINLETARVYNKNDRKNLELDYEEYIKGYHMELDEATGELQQMFAKKGMKELMEGTSLDNIERTALSNLDDSLRKAYTTHAGGTEFFDVDAYLQKRDEIQTAIGPQFISASLKYLSGSEQLVSAVKFLTGYGKKQKVETYIDDDGQERKRTVDEWEAVWDKEIDENGNKTPAYDKLKDYFRKKTLKYLEDQTPSQILGLRSDYFMPLYSHLSETYEEAGMEGMNDEEIREHEKYVRERAEIQTRYGDLPEDEAKRRRKKDEKELKNKMAGAQFRKILRDKGKLYQIYRTRRSGAANNAKDWVRDWLDLDNDSLIELKLKNDRAKTQAELKKLRSQEGEANNISDEINSDERITVRLRTIEDLYYSSKDMNADAVYDELLKYTVNELGKNSYIVKMFEEFYENDPYVDAHTIKEYLKDLMSDPENY